jgi:hypothetical protein
MLPVTCTAPSFGVASGSLAAPETMPADSSARTEVLPAGLRHTHRAAFLPFGVPRTSAPIRLTRWCAQPGKGRTAQATLFLRGACERADYPDLDGQRLDQIPPDTRTERRISRDGRGQRSSRSATDVPERERTERRIGMPTEAVGICEPMLTAHPFGLGVAWLMAGRPMGAFYPFLSGRGEPARGSPAVRAPGHEPTAGTALGQSLLVCSAPAVARRRSRREPGGFLPGSRVFFA